MSERAIANLIRETPRRTWNFIVPQKAPLPEIIAQTMTDGLVVLGQFLTAKEIASGRITDGLILFSITTGALILKRNSKLK